MRRDGKIRGKRRTTRFYSPLVGWRIGFTADAKSRWQAHCFPRYWKKNYPCEGCLCQKPSKYGSPELTFMDFSPGAGWRRTRLDHATFMRMEPPQFHSPYFQIRGIELNTCFRDIMHVVYLGFARDLGASLAMVWLLSGSLVLWVRNEWGAEPSTSDEALSYLWKGLRRWCKDNKTHGSRPRFNVFNLVSMQRTARSQYPKLSTKVKAMQMKVPG